MVVDTIILAKAQIIFKEKVMQKARNTSVKIFMNGVDVTRDLSPHLKALTFTDNLS